jgi:Lar family restriction alleviation protein
MKRKKTKVPLPPIKLSSCPFCGMAAAKLASFRAHDDEPPTFHIDCEACHANGPVMGGNAARAKVAWNTRGGPIGYFSPENRGMPECVYGEETAEEREEREDSGLPAASRVNDPSPCPFCSSGDIYVEQGVIRDGKKQTSYWYTFCGICEACGPADDTSIGFATLLWNKRVS